MLGVNPKFQDSDSLGIKVYKEVDYGLKEMQKELGVLVEIPMKMETEDFKESGLESIVYGQDHYDILGIFTSELRNKKDYSLEDLQAKQRLFSTTRLLELNVENLVNGLEAVLRYVDRVRKGELEPSPQVSALLQRALAPMAKVTAEEVEVLLREHYQDLLFIQQITNLTQTQIELSQKLAAKE